MKKIEIIKNKKYFDELIHNSKFIKNKYFVIYYKKMTNENKSPMFGIAISNNIGNAVKRNKVKRQMKNILDKNKKRFNNDHFYIIIIRKEINLISYSTMEQELIKLMEDKS